MSVIPGADVLGYGFNILGDYDTSSLTTQLFTHKNMDAQSWTYPASGRTYEVPDNTSIIPDTGSTGSAQIFDTRQQFQNYFSGKASIKTSYGAFSAQFNAAYSSTFHTDKSYYYGLYDADFTGWGLAIADQSPSWVSSSFVNDPDIQNLPASFTPLNQEQFFTVFRKFGTHFVAQVTLGGSLYYYLAVEKSYTQNETQVEANVTLEYKAVFTSSKATASAEWQTLGQTWADSRIVTVSASGGDASVLSALDPGYGDSDVDIFTAWSSAVIQNPAAVGFQLRPLNLLFSGDTAAAVQAALQVYTNGAIIAVGNSDYTPGRGPGGGNFTTSSSVMVNGSVILPSPQVTPPPPYIFEGPPIRLVNPVGGYQVALLDPTTFAPIMSHIYYQILGSGADAEQQIYADMMTDIGGVTTAGYLAVVAAFGMDLANYPLPAFAQWLSSCGATLSDWKNYQISTLSPGQTSYVCIGKQGLMPGNAVEAFAAAADYVDNPSQATTDASALALLYAPSTLDRGGTRAYRSLVSAPAAPA